MHPQPPSAARHGLPGLVRAVCALAGRALLVEADPHSQPEKPYSQFPCKGPFSGDNCTPARGADFCQAPGVCHRYSDMSCCCPELPSPYDDTHCRLDPYKANGTECVQWCCKPHQWPCGDGCCFEGGQCGYNFSTHTDHTGHVRNFYCCVDKDVDIAVQDREGCCAWGVGKRCGAPSPQPCCAKCKHPQQSAGLLHCEMLDPEYDCQRDLARCPKRASWMPWATACAALSASAVAAAVLWAWRGCSCPWRGRSRWLCGRCCRPSAQGSTLLAGPSTHPEEVGDLPEPEWFALLVGIPRYYAKHEDYPDLERVEGDLLRLRAKLLDVQPGLRAGNIMEVKDRQATREGLDRAKRVLLDKLANTQGARVLFYFAGHGHDNFMVVQDGLVQIDVFFAEVRKCSRRGIDCENAVEPQVVAMFDACRDRAPEAQCAFRPSHPGRQDGRLYLLHATDPGRGAADGLFTDELLKALDVPGLSLAELVDRMNGAVPAHQRFQLVHDGNRATQIVIHSRPPRSASSTTMGSLCSSSQSGWSSHASRIWQQWEQRARASTV